MDTYHWESEVRDSELDLQGIVNNSVYYLYMEHCRHKHTKELGADFAKLHELGLDLVIRHSELTYFASLKSGDEFIVTSSIKLNKIRIIFTQEVIRKSDGKVVTTGVFTIVGIDRNKGKIIQPEVIQELFSQIKA